MTKKKPKSVVPNHLLREERERRNWSHKDVADRIQLPDSPTVGRWERGMTFPQPHYRQRLCEVFDKTAAELGLERSRAAHEKSATQDAALPVPSPAVVPLSPIAGEPPVARTIFIWNVPAALTSFVGRQQEVESVCSLLTDKDIRLVTLLGPGGIGKTRLGTEVAHALRSYFVNGVCFVSFAAIDDPDLVLSTLAQALELEQGTALPLLEQVKHLLRDRHLLLLLDNFDLVRRAAPLLEELLVVCAGIKILVTSRAVLHSQAEYEFVVAPLAVPAVASPFKAEQLYEYSAIELFVQRARAHLSSFHITEQNAPALVEICQRLDGLPLAIEVVAAHSKMLSPQMLLNMLHQSLRVLVSPLSTLPDRQRTLYNIVKWSYDLLQPSEQWLFRHLALFADRASLEDITALLTSLSEQPLAIVQGLSTLLDNSLLQKYEQEEGEPGEPLFYLLEMMREFGRETLKAQGELERGQRAHARYYLELVEQAAPLLKSAEQTHWLALLEQCKAELRVALLWFVERSPVNAASASMVSYVSIEEGAEDAEDAAWAPTACALRFAEACGKFYGLRGYWSEEWYWLRAVLALHGGEGVPAVVKIRARVLRRAGHLAYRLRYLTQAYVWQQESVELSRAQRDLVNLAGALTGLAWTLYRQKEIVRARELLDESLTTAQSSGDYWSLANTLERVGRFEYEEGHYREARTLLNESIHYSRQVGDRESLARILTTAVAIELAEGNIEHATVLTAESQQLAQELGTRPLIALVLDSKIDIVLAQEDYASAIVLCDERIALAQDLGDRPTESRVYLRLGKIALIQGNLLRARIYVQSALDYFQNQQDYSNITRAQTLLAEIEQAS
ncbi:tetratricopeptide repeat protein [Ktedonobacteria bacterium brp13]|nr:tetratricopeptide repeat protein [Ktedonobacteria bacterium brp13]